MAHLAPAGQPAQRAASGRDWKYAGVSVWAVLACHGWVLSVAAGALGACHDAGTRDRRRWCTGPPGRGCGSPRAQRRRLVGLLVSAGDVWACVLELNGWRRARQDRPLVSFQELCRELAAAGPGCFGELDTTGARSVLRRYCDAWFAAAQRRRDGDQRARFPRRRRALMPLRWYHGTFTLTGRRLRIPVARGRPPLWVRLDRDLPYPPGQVRSVTLLYDAGGCGPMSPPRCRSPVTPMAGSRTRPGSRGSIWGSSTRTRWPGPAARGCWCRGGRSAPSTGCT